MQDEKINIKDLNIAEIENIIYDITSEKFRAKQIFIWLYKGICSFDEMTNLSINLRNKLQEKLDIYCAKLLNVQEAKEHTKKYLFQLHDENTIESVLMKYKYGNTACISTQAGCKMGCRFCASTKLGLERNLTAGEIVDQIISIQKESNERVSKVVYMGIGEPLANYDNTIKSLKLLNDENGLNIGYRNISVSTCGLVPEIKRFAEEKLPVTLSISLHAPNDNIRNKIMPINLKYNIKQLIEACDYYIKLTKRKVYFEYILLDGINDSEKDAKELSELLKRKLAHINIINLNPASNIEFKRTTPAKTKAFIDTLIRYGTSATLRRELGSDIDAACGQLRVKRLSQTDK